MNAKKQRKNCKIVSLKVKIGDGTDFFMAERPVDIIGIITEHEPIILITGHLSESGR